MTISTKTGWDAIHDNLSAAPKDGQPAGYDTGSAGIAWSSADYHSHPGALHIDQDFRASDRLADWLDVETNAATPQETSGWVTQARANFHNNVRPGQRWPGIYANRSNLTQIANDLASAHLTDVPVWLADPGIGLAAAVAMIEAQSGPLPIKGVQYEFPSTGSGGPFDLDVWDAEYLATVSGNQTPPPGQTRKVVPVGNTQSLENLLPNGVSMARCNSASVQFLSPQHLTVFQTYVACQSACDVTPGIERCIAPVGMVYYY